MFGDYYYVLAHHDETVEGNNGFWLRRVYFTYDNTLSDTLRHALPPGDEQPGRFQDIHDA